MRTFKEKNGFTLIELLAVIVVLAIVMVMATSTILPYLSRSRYNAFAIEVNATRDAASKAMTLVTIGSISSSELANGDDYKKVSTDTGDKYCFTLKKLVELGLIENKDSDDLGSKGYEGKVIVESKKDSRAYSYTVTMHSPDFYVKDIQGTLDGEDDEIVAFSNQSGFTCSNLS